MATVSLHRACGTNHLRDGIIIEKPRLPHKFDAIDKNSGKNYWAL